MGLFGTLFYNQIRRAALEVVANTYDRNVFRYIGDGQTILDEDTYDYNKAFKQTGAVYECVDLITKKIVASPRIVYKIKDEEQFKIYKGLMRSENIGDRARAKLIKAGGEVFEEVKVPKIDDLLERPNHLQNGDEFIRMIAGAYLLRGNAYMYGNAGIVASRKWSELFALPDMHIVSGGMFEPIKGYFLNWGDQNEEEFPAGQVKHIKTFNPNYSSTGSQLYGMSPLSPYLYSISKIKNANIQSDTQLKNGGNMGFVAPKNKEDQLSDTQKLDLKSRLSKAYKSTESLSRIIPASIPMEWTEIGLSSADMELLRISGASADDIYLGYHVPLPFRNTDASSYNNLTTANKQFIYNAVAPIADEISTALTEFICGPYNTGASAERYVISIDYTSLPELTEDMKALAEWLANSWDMTPNEKREVKGWGRLEAPGMDEIWVPKGYIRMADIMAGNINAVDRGGQAPYQAGDPNNPSNTDNQLL